MGLKTFINNIRYLARYNIKEMNRRFDEKLDYKHLLKIANLLPYLDNKDIKKANILNVEDTIDLLIKSDKSMVRYGDGEFALMDGKDLSYEMAKGVMEEMMDGTATQAQMGAFLAALRMQGETIDEITAFACCLFCLQKVLLKCLHVPARHKTATYQHMASGIKGHSENITIATVLYTQAAAQFFGPHGKITHRHICLRQR